MSTVDFDIEQFLELAFNDDACHAGTYMDEYLKACGNTKDFVWSHGVLTVGFKDGSRHFKIEVEEIEL